MKPLYVYLALCIAFCRRLMLQQPTIQEEVRCEAKIRRRVVWIESTDRDTLGGLERRECDSGAWHIFGYLII